MATRASALFRPPAVLYRLSAQTMLFASLMTRHSQVPLLRTSAFPHQLICATWLMADIRDRRLENLPDS